MNLVRVAGDGLLAVAGDGRVRFVEGPAGRPLLRAARDAAVLVECCRANRVDAALLYAENVTPRFFDLSSGDATAVLRTLRTNGIRLALVCGPGVIDFSSGFAQMAAEEAAGGDFRLCDSRDAGRRWLRERIANR